MPRSRFLRNGAPTLALTNSNDEAASDEGYHENHFAVYGGPPTKKPTDEVVMTGPDGRPQRKKRTQKDQDDDDEKARKKAIEHLVQSWMDRLQLISVITTFFAATEADLLHIVTPERDELDNLTTASLITNATFMGALIMHTFAAIVSFLASFFLIRFKLMEAKKEERQVLVTKAQHQAQEPSQELSHSPTDIEKAAEARSSSEPRPSHEGITGFSGRDILRAQTQDEGVVWSTNPHLVSVGPLGRLEPPTNLLSKCHTLCIVIACLGFFLAVVGIVSYAWAKMPTSVSVFATACTGLCVLSGFYLLFQLPSSFMMFMSHAMSAISSSFTTETKLRSTHI